MASDDTEPITGSFEFRSLAFRRTFPMLKTKGLLGVLVVGSEAESVTSYLVLFASGRDEVSAEAAIFRGAVNSSYRLETESNHEGV
jgi:hypothetical protein